MVVKGPGGTWTFTPNRAGGGRKGAGGGERPSLPRSKVQFVKKCFKCQQMSWAPALQICLATGCTRTAPRPDQAPPSTPPSDPAKHSGRAPWVLLTPPGSTPPASLATGSSAQPCKLSNHLEKLAQEILPKPAEEPKQEGAEVTTKAIESLKRTKVELEGMPGMEAHVASIAQQIADIEQRGAASSAAQAAGKEEPAPAAAKRLWEDAAANMKRARAAVDAHTAELEELRARIRDMEARTAPLMADLDKADKLHQEALTRLVKANKRQDLAAEGSDGDAAMKEEEPKGGAAFQKLEELKGRLHQAGNGTIPEEVQTQYQTYAATPREGAQAPLTLEQWYVQQCSVLLEQALSAVPDASKRRKLASGVPA